VPTTLALEKKTNPFLRVRDAGLREAIIHHAGVSSMTDEEAFGIVRRWKDDFDGLKPL
jgi:hydroxyacylglutathione hydrolase